MLVNMYSKTTAYSTYFNANSKPSEFPLWTYRCFELSGVHSAMHVTLYIVLKMKINSVRPMITNTLIGSILE